MTPHSRTLPLIGVTPWWAVGSLKQHLLICDEILLPEEEDEVLDGISMFFGEAKVADLRWLEEREVVKIAKSYPVVTDLMEAYANEAEPTSPRGKQLAELMGSSINAMGNYLLALKWSKQNKGSAEEQLRLKARLSEVTVRLESALMRTGAMDAVTLAPESLIHTDTDGKVAGVIEVVVDNLPMPSASASLEAIMEFRADDRVRQFHRDLRVWMLRAAQSEATARELAGEIESAVSKFERFMNNYRIEATKGAWVNAMNAAAVGGIAGVGMGEVAAVVGAVGAFVATIRHRTASLHNAELTAPGAELAYIVKARERFGE